MTPVPWKKSCRWKSTDLFVACGLILTDSKTKRNLTNIDDQCKLNYTEIFSHEKLHEESRIILEGDPGSGKTMLSSQLAYDWSQGKISGINILIFLPLKLVENKTLVEAIRDFYLPEDNSLSLSDIEDVIAYEGIECCFLLDGLEEYNGENTSTVEEPSEIMKIMTKQKYPSCKVVITSRSDYAQDLPPCPILKIGQFGQFERSAYIEKVFSSDREKQLKVKEAVEDSPFILDICKIPLLFVLAVHIIAEKKTVHEGQLNRVTPFIKNIVESLCTPGSSLREVWKKGLVYNKYQDNWRDMLHLKDFSNVSTHDCEDAIAYSESNVPIPHGHELLQSKSEPISLEMLAFNGLCKGNQQLSWSKSFVEDSVKDIKQWMDSGILVIEEAVAVVKAAQKTTPKSPEEKDTQKSWNGNIPSTSVSWNIKRYTDSDTAEAIKEGILGETQTVTAGDDIGNIPLAGELRTSNASFADFGMTQRGVKSDNKNSTLSRNDESVAHQYSAVKSEVDDQSTFTPREANQSSTFALKHVPLQIKFLHKIIQEWFAGRHLASLCWRYTKLPLLKQYELLRKHLHHINPADLHYVLRFTCYLCPPSCHFILNYLLVTYRSEEEDIPEYILNCICLCLAEAEDDKDDYLKDITSEICKITFTIQPEDSRLLQAAKSALLKFASNCGFPIPRLILRDVVVKAKKDELTFNSGGTMETLETLQVLEISRWDEPLKEKDYYNVMEFIASSASIRMAYLHFPVPQPPVPSEETLEKLMFHHTSVTWKIGSKLSLELDTATGEWKLSVGEDAVQVSGPIQAETNSGTRKSMSDYKDKENYVTCKIGSTMNKKFETSTEEWMTNIHMTKSTAVQDKDTKDDNTDTTVDNLYKEGFIDEHGGTLFLHEADISLHVPAGALSRGYLIRIIVPMNLGSIFTGSQVSHRVTPLTICEPDNLFFKSPVKLTLPHCAVIKTPGDHKVNVKFGYKDDNAKEMIWKSEAVDSSLGEHYCSVFLNHFSGVDVGISSTEEKILRVIPYTKLQRNNKLYLRIWFCNDVESDFQSVMQTEENNAGIPLDSYDTFQVNFVSGPGKSNVKVKLEGLHGNSWHFEKSEDTIHVDRLSDKSKSSFMLQGPDADGGESYMYLILKITQTVALEERDTTFVVRKMIRDLKTPVMFPKPCCQYEHVTNHLLPTEKQKTRTYTAVVYMDPVKDREDDAILTLWLSPFLSTSDMFQSLQKEQELQFRHRVDTENSFLVFNDKVAVISKTRFLNGKWILSPEEKKIETDRIRFGSRAKFQFIGRRKEHVDTDYIDLEVEVFQEEENKLKFMSDVEMDDLLYEIRRRKRQESAASASKEPATVSREVQTIGQHQLAINSIDHAVEGNISSSKIEGKSETTEEQLKHCFMFLKRNIAGDWKDLGRCLNISEDELIRLSKDYKDDTGEIIYQMLLSWQRKNGALATPEILIKNLEKISRKDLADKLATLPS